VVILMLGAGVISVRQAWAAPRITAREDGYDLPLLRPQS
jgi:hypothetical protein